MADSRIGVDAAQVARRHVGQIICRAAALPLMFGLLLFPRRLDVAMHIIGRAHAARFWNVRRPGQWFDIAAAILLWPFCVIIAALWFTSQNGAIVAARAGRSVIGQFYDQLRLAATTGTLPPWYYVFELYRPGAAARARDYLTRGQTKFSAFRILAKARNSNSPLKDKLAFAHFCAERHVSAIPVLLSAQEGELRGPIRTAEELPPIDLFVKPARSRGGRGAERWDYLGDGIYQRIGGAQLSAEQFLERLCRISLDRPYIVQERAHNHPAMADLSNGALNTLRVLSCLDEQGRPEVVGAVLRIATRGNVIVDNVHAGGLAAAVDLESGRLSPATDIGLYAQHGWIDCHPATGAMIAGRAVPMWGDVLELVRHAHLIFRDWAIIGWDVGVMADGPRLVEGNCGPDVDLIQRPLRTPFGSGRLGALLAFHLQQAARQSFVPSRERPALARSRQFRIPSWDASSVQTSSAKLSRNPIRSINPLAARRFPTRALGVREQDGAHISGHLHRSLVWVAALAPEFGYYDATAIAKHAHNKGLTLKEAGLELGLVDEQAFDRLVEPERMLGC